MAGQKPDKSFKHGRVGCAVWKNKGGEDSVYYTATFNRSYKPKGEDGYKQTQSFGGFDLMHLVWCAVEAFHYINKATTDAKSNGKDAPAEEQEEFHPE